MSSTAVSSRATLIGALAAAFARAAHASEGTATPRAIVWTDVDGQWRPLLGRLKTVVPHLYELGHYRSEDRIGPVIWLKCVVDRSIPEIAPPYAAVPVLYLPGVDRQLLRAAGDCPPNLQPLVELQYRGEVWRQRNGRDWTVDAFVTSNDGLGLEVAGDSLSRSAMLRTLAILGDADLTSLRGRRLDESDFNALAVSDPVRDVLLWIADPDTFRSAMDIERWESFRSICGAMFQFDPGNTDASLVASKLADGYGQWNVVWRRFRESPLLYSGVARQLRDPLSAPRDLLADVSRQPLRNDEAEARLRENLAAAAFMPQHDACDRVLALENEHGERRGWIWSELGESPFAVVLAPLAVLAGTARSPIGGASVEVMANTYAERGWRGDQAATSALALATKWSQRDRQIIADLVRTLYLPWLDASARRFQELVGQRSDGLAGLVSATPSDRETCVVFADGLRFDAGAMVHAKLEARSFRATLTHRIAPLPTVTATAKPAAAPLKSAVDTASKPGDFCPRLVSNGQSVTALRLRDALSDNEIDVLDRDTPRMPSGLAGGGWMEMGNLDALGHQLGVDLASHVNNEADAIAECVAGLLDAGWTRVRVVTDHGWLLLPGGLPKVELPPSLAATKWARCAEVIGDSATDVPTYPWHWNPQVRIACPWGIGAFVAGTEYTHGGVSLQECVVPEVLVERIEVKLSARIRSVEWRGMRCRVTVDAASPTVRVDLRRNRRQPDTSLVAQMKSLDASDEVSLVVEDDSDEGAAATVVLLDMQDNILDYKPTTVGEDQ